MLVIGELINGMYKNVRKAIKAKDADAIKRLAEAQAKAGAGMLDVNVGPASADPKGTMEWLVDTIQSVTDLPLAIDTPNLEVMEAGLKRCKRKPMLNSTTGQQDKLEAAMDLAAKYKASVIGLTMDEKGIPRDADGRNEIALRIVAAAMEKGVPSDEIYIDPLILPCNVTQQTAGIVLEAIRQCKVLADPPPKTVLGLSNVSQGTQERPLLNRTYLVMALAQGLDAAIMDPLDDALMDAMIAAELLLNKHIYCDSFLKAYRKGG